MGFFSSIINGVGWGIGRGIGNGIIGLAKEMGVFKFLIWGALIIIFGFVAFTILGLMGITILR